MAQTYITGGKIQLAKKLRPGDSVITATTDIGITKGRIYFVNDDQQEWISFNGVASVGGYYEYTIVLRSLSQSAIPITGTTGLTWLAGNIGVIVAMHDQLQDLTQGLTPPSYTTAQRLALTPDNGALVYDIDDNQNYQYLGGAWYVIAAGSTQPNASETVSGKVEVGTQAEADAGTEYGGTGAYLMVTPKTFQQGITNKLTSKATAEAGTNNTELVTPLRVQQNFNYNNTIYSLGDGGDGNVTISGNTTLTRNMYYNNLTINNGVTLYPAGYCIFVKGTLTNNGTISRNGNNGGDAVGNTTPGAGGTKLASGYFDETSVGGIGGSGFTTTYPPWKFGGDGGSGTGFSSASGGAGQTKMTYSLGGDGGTGTKKRLWNANAQTLLSAIIFGESIATYKTGGGGGGGGPYWDGQNSSCGGGGGGSGGVIYISADTIVNNGTITAKGGNGGAGGINGGAIGGVGGGGAGGTVILRYKTLSALGTVTVTGGTGGNAGGVGEVVQIVIT